MHELQHKLAQLQAQILAIAGIQGVGLLHELGDDAANAYVNAMLEKTSECLRLTQAS